MAQPTVRKDNFNSLKGAQKAAMLLMAVEEETATKVFNMMEDEEIREISGAMTNLGQVSSEMVERLIVDFVDQMSASGAVMGNFDTTERLLQKALGKDRVGGILEDLRGPAGRTTWDKLGNVSEDVLANFLKNEYPQTIALVLSKIKPDHAARVLTALPEDISMDVIMRMLKMEAVRKEVLDNIEKTLRTEFMSNLAKTQRQDSHEIMAEIFNNFDRNTEAKFMGELEDRDEDSAERVRNLMFTFEDLLKVDATGVQNLMRVLDKEKLGIALKGASDAVKDLFFDNMSERAAKILKEDMEAMGPVRLKDVDEAQMYVVSEAKELAAKGEIVIAEGGGDDELVY